MTEVARALRGLPGAKDAVIALHTAMTDTDLRTLAQHPNSAVNLYLSKPITPEKLHALTAELQPHAKKKMV